MSDQELIAADVDFRPLIKNFLKVLHEQGMTNTDVSLYIKTARGRSEFIRYCDACLRLELVSKTGVSPEVIKNTKDEQRAIISADN
jgi:hypothetical protein